MTSYASQKGRVQPASQPQQREAVRPALTPAQMAEVQANKDFIVGHAPELVPFIRDICDGWRDVKNCRLLDDVGHE